jgi:hypothetical protein
MESLAIIVGLGIVLAGAAVFLWRSTPEHGPVESEPDDDSTNDKLMDVL